MQTSLELRPFGETGMRITSIGFGAWAVGGNDWKFGWGAQDDDASIGAIRKALDLGINWIDTAAAYGFGHSEEVVARALDGMSEKPLVFTKCGLVPSGDPDGGTREDITRDSIVRECEASLRRLRVEAIDLYQIHWPTDEIADIDEGWAAMLELKTAGKVRHVGVSNFDVAELERARKIGPVETLQPPYSLVKRDVEHEILPYCERNEIGVIVYAPMQSGLLTGSMTAERAAALPPDDWRSRNPEFRQPKLAENLALVERLRAVGARHGRSAGETAIAWTLHNSAVTAAIVGGRSADQVAGTIGAASFSAERRRGRGDRELLAHRERGPLREERLRSPDVRADVVAIERRREAVLTRPIVHREPRPFEAQPERMAFEEFGNEHAPRARCARGDRVRPYRAFVAVHVAADHAPDVLVRFDAPPEFARAPKTEDVEIVQPRAERRLVRRDHGRGLGPLGEPRVEPRERLGIDARARLRAFSRHVERDRP